MSSTAIGSSSQTAYQTPVQSAPPPPPPPNNAANADLGVNPPPQASPAPQASTSPPYAPSPGPGLGQNVNITV